MTGLTDNAVSLRAFLQYFWFCCVGKRRQSSQCREGNSRKVSNRYVHPLSTYGMLLTSCVTLWHRPLTFWPPNSVKYGTCRRVVGMHLFFVTFPLRLKQIAFSLTTNFSTTVEKFSFGHATTTQTIMYVKRLNLHPEGTSTGWPNF